MTRYAVSILNAGSQQNLSSSYKSLIEITAATGATTLRRAWIYDVLMGTDGTPADNEISWKIDRQTSVGTGSSATPAPLDFADAAALSTATTNVTIEGIVTGATQLLQVGVNQRASYRWVASPGGEFIVPGVNVAGIGVRALSAGYTSTALCSLNYWE